MKYYPIYLRLKDRPVLLVGAGDVAAQKIIGLLEAEAHITVVAPHALLAIQLLAREKKIRWLKRRYQHSDLKGKSLVIAATNNPKTHQQIARQARAANIWVNVVDVTPLCDFIAPAVVNRGGIQIAISTGGAAPALAKFLRQKLQPLIGPEYGELVELAQRYRPHILKLPKPARLSLWGRIAHDDFIAHIRTYGKESAEKTLQEWIDGKPSI